MSKTTKIAADKPIIVGVDDGYAMTKVVLMQEGKVVKSGRGWHLRN